MKTYRVEGYEWRHTRLAQFIERYGYGSLAQLQQQSIENPEPFWEAVVAEIGLTWLTPYAKVLDTRLGVQWPSWFAGGKLNIVHDAVDKWARTTPSRTALRWEGDDGSVRSMSCAELEAEVNRFANALLGLGVERGDRVAMYLPMIPEAAVTLLAVAKIGAVVVPFFSGFGADSVAARLQDSEASVLVCADGYYRRGKRVDMLGEAREAAGDAPSVKTVVVVPRLGREQELAGEGGVRGDAAPAERNYDALCARASPTLDATAMDTVEPLMLIYTSGTTGKPKGVVHTHLGFFVKACQDMVMCFDLRPSDTLMWVTDMGWMMGPWLVYGALPLGAAIVLYEGAPDYPNPDRLWRVVERHGITHLGLSPTLVRLLMAAGDTWLKPEYLAKLRVFGSTGEPWNELPWQWLFEKVGERKRPIINYSGGTEIGGGILGCFPGLPLKPCGFCGQIPGVAADVWDATGRSVRGEVGELVIRRPWPGMTQGFWRDPERYLQTYWSRWPDIWVHGDWARIDDDGFWFVQGRSDDTIKVAGKRVGPADYESVLVSHPIVREAVAIGVQDEIKGECAVCFVTVRDGAATPWDSWESWESELREHVARHLGKALKPSRVHRIPELPKTKNGKIMRRVIKSAYLGKDPGDVTALDNPHALRDIGEIRRSIIS